MAKPKKPAAEDGKTGRFVVGSAGFDKINAVEGIALTAAMKKRARDARANGLTAEEYRRAIVSSYRKD